MRSPLEVISGRYEHAIFTTYSINLHFFEEWVMPLLRTAGVRNTIILCDEAQLGAALADRSLRSLGRSYHAVAVRLGPGAFHPKLIALHGEDGMRVCISSANLTVAGQLRNVEGAVVLDSTTATHQNALGDINTFLRRVVEATAPPHTMEAALAALPTTDTETARSHIRFVHNLDAPLLTHFPTSDLTAVTPYVDAGEAARALRARGQLRIVTDADAFAAPAAFFANDWVIEALAFEGRRLHGKAYWTSATNSDQNWLMIGSPNLSRQALLSTATEANTEVAVVIAPQEAPLDDPPGAPATGEPLAQTAPRRHAVKHEAAERAEANGSFNAWEDEASIRVSGVADGVPLGYWSEGAWRDLGRVTSAAVVPPLDLRPYLIRATTGSTHRYAIVHRAEQLRIQRLRPRTTSRAADVVSTLPLDIAGVQALESVLKDLYLLASLEGGEAETQRRQPAGEDSQDHRAGISEWVPARSDDEPRIPDIYRQQWQNAPDALLALIRSALRLDAPAPANERDVLEESLDLDIADAQLEEADDALTAQEQPVPQVEERVLRRYQQSLNKLLERGSVFVRGVDDPALADLGFQAVLRLHERLDRFTVEVAGEQRDLLERHTLLGQKLALLDSYLRERAGSDPICLATARVHLAHCLSERAMWTPLDWERLEALGDRFARMLLAANAHAQTAARDAEIELADVDARLQPYADRSVWDGFYVEAEKRFDLLDFGDQPFPWVLGEDWFDETPLSTTWEIAGYAAVVAFATNTSFAVLARNADRRSPYLTHVLICEPHARKLHEALQRRIDGHWLTRTYTTVREGTISNFLRIRSHALEEAACPRSSLADIGATAGAGIVADALATAGLAPVLPSA
jgi:hypothetical protein